MEGSIFSRLFHYHTTDKRTPQEDYLTELLAWMIDSLPQFGQDYVTFLCNNSKVKIQHNEKCAVNAETQVVVSKGRIDMVITVGSDLCFVCEHKVDSCLRENQIPDYRDCEAEIKEKYGVDKVYFVFLSKIEDKLEKKQKPDIIVRWHDIYKHVVKNFDNNTYNSSENKIINQFIMYLTEVGMGMKEAINLNGIAHYSAAMDVEPLLNSIFNDIYDDICKNDIEKQFPGIHNFLRESKFILNTPRKESGRIGIKFSETWHPGLFSGVQLNNKDDSLQSFDSPQLVVIIDCMPDEKKKFQKEPWYKSIEKQSKEIEKQSKEDAETEFHIQTESKNKWRVLILHKPLEKVLEKSESYEEQKKKIMDEIIAGINLILNYYNENM